MCARTKVLANRLYPATHILIDANQAELFHSTNNAENFMYAADLLSYRHKRHALQRLFSNSISEEKTLTLLCGDSLDAIFACT
jgi:hypothetical protein